MRGRDLSRRAIWRLTEALAERTGNELVPRTYYSPLPDLERLSEELWRVPRPIEGVELRVEQGVALLEELAPLIDEFRPPIEPPADGSGFYIENGGYGSVDAEVLYAMLRRVRPARVVELGSGASSHVISAAARANARHSHPFEHLIFDPFPFEANPLGPVDGPVVSAVGVEQIDADVIAGLGQRDVLFVDTTHTVKTGGDVNRVVLEFLPLLAPGVLVHFHDVFLPWEYPRGWVIDERRAYAEQYLLQSFLAFNSAYEVVFPAHAVTRAAPDLVASCIRSYRAGVAPGAFWIRRTG